MNISFNIYYRANNLNLNRKLKEVFEMLENLNNWFNTDPGSFLLAFVFVILLFICIIGLLIVLLILNSSTGSVKRVNSKSSEVKVSLKTRTNLNELDSLVINLANKLQKLIDESQGKPMTINIIVSSWKDLIGGFLYGLSQISIPSLRRKKFIQKRDKIMHILSISSFSSCDQFYRSLGNDPLTQFFFNFVKIRNTELFNNKDKVISYLKRIVGTLNNELGRNKI